MSSLLGNLPPVHGRRTQQTGGRSGRLVTPPSASPPHFSRTAIRPLRLALRFSPPSVALEYEHIASKQRRCKECSLDNTRRTSSRHTHVRSRDSVCRKQSPVDSRAASAPCIALTHNVCLASPADAVSAAETTRQLQHSFPHHLSHHLVPQQQVRPYLLP